MSTYLPAILVIALLYGLLGISLNLEWGHTGIINFGHVAFFATGAYTTSLLTTRTSAGIAPGLIAAFVMAALLALPIGWITLRLSSDFLAIVTIGFAETLRIILLNAGWSGGPSGITGIPRPLTTLDVQQFNLIWAGTVALAVIAAMLVLRNISRSPFGRVLRAIRADERAAAMLGKNVAAAKTTSLVIGSGLAGLAGAIYAHYIGYIAPDQFEPSVTFFVWAGIIIGGSSHVGALIGTIGLVGLLEASRFLGDFGFTAISATHMANLRLIAVGLLIILFVRFRPQGAFPSRAPGRRGASVDSPTAGGLVDATAAAAGADTATSTSTSTGTGTGTDPSRHTEGQ